MFCLDAKPKLFFWSGLWQDLIMASVCVHLYCLAVIDLIVGIRVIALSSPPLHHYSTYHHGSPSLHELLNWWGWWCPLEGSWVLSMCVCVCVCCNDNIGGLTTWHQWHQCSSMPGNWLTELWRPAGHQPLLGGTSHCHHNISLVVFRKLEHRVRFYLKQ